MKVSVQIILEGETDKAIGFFEEIYESEDNEGCLNKLAQAIIYAIPKQHFGEFDVIDICYQGKSVGHGEN